MKHKTGELLEQARLDENHSSLSSAEKTFSGEAEATRVFGALKTKLSNIEEWNTHAMLCSFKLFDENGAPRSSAQIVTGAFMQLSLTGTMKYDWVRIENIHEAAEEFIITVRPTFDPTAENADKSVISHFFTDESTNNFCLLKSAARIGLYVIGVNEKMNTAETAGALDAVRNAAVNVGTYLGVQRSEWEKFCHHFLDEFGGIEDK